MCQIVAIHAAARKSFSEEEAIKVLVRVQIAMSRVGSSRLQTHAVCCQLCRRISKDLCKHKNNAYIFSLVLWNVLEWNFWSYVREFRYKMEIIFIYTFYINVNTNMGAMHSTKVYIWNFELKFYERKFQMHVFLYGWRVLSHVN